MGDMEGEGKCIHDSTVRGCMEEVGSHEKKLQVLGHIVRGKLGARFTRAQANFLIILAKIGVRAIHGMYNVMHGMLRYLENSVKSCPHFFCFKVFNDKEG